MWKRLSVLVCLLMWLVGFHCALGSVYNLFCWPYCFCIVHFGLMLGLSASQILFYVMCTFLCAHMHTNTHSQAQMNSCIQINAHTHRTDKPRPLFTSFFLFFSSFHHTQSCKMPAPFLLCHQKSVSDWYMKQEQHLHSRWLALKCKKWRDTERKEKKVLATLPKYTHSHKVCMYFKICVPTIQPLYNGQQSQIHNFQYRVLTHLWPWNKVKVIQQSMIL